MHSDTNRLGSKFTKSLDVTKAQVQQLSFSFGIFLVISTINFIDFILILYYYGSYTLIKFAEMMPMTATEVALTYTLLRLHFA